MVAGALGDHSGTTGYRRAEQSGMDGCCDPRGCDGMFGAGYAQERALTKDAAADPAAVKAAADLRQTMFMDDTLRGMLLNAYAFGTLGTIAIYAAIASFIGAAAMAVLSLLGWRHLRRVPAEEQVRLGGHQPAPALG